MDKRNNNRQIKIGMCLSYITILVGIITGLVYTPWMLKILGESDYGIYTIANTAISILLMDFGLSIAVTRFTAKYIEDNNYEALQMFYAVINKLYFVIDCIIFIAFIIMLFLIPSIYQALTIEEITKLRLIFAALAIYSLVSFQFIPSDGILTAFESFAISKASVLVVKVCTVCFTALFLYLGYGLYAIIGCHIVFGLAGILFKKLYIRYKLRIIPNYRAKRNISYKELGAFAGWITVIQLGDRLFLSIIPTILGAVAGSFEVTIFGLAITLESFVFSIISSANSLFFPRVSRVYNSDDTNSSATFQLLVKVGKLQTFIGGLIICGFAGVGKIFIGLWSDNMYINAYYATLLIIIPICLEQSQGIAMLAMQVSGKLKQIAIAQVVCGCVNVLLALELGKFYGAIGGATAFMSVKIAQIIYNNYIFNKVLGINMFKFYKEVYIPFFPAFLSTVTVGVSIQICTTFNGWGMFLGASVLMAITYVLMSWCFVLKKEKNIFISFNKKLINKE